MIHEVAPLHDEQCNREQSCAQSLHLIEADVLNVPTATLKWPEESDVPKTFSSHFCPPLEDVLPKSNIGGNTKEQINVMTLYNEKRMKEVILFKRLRKLNKMLFSALWLLIED